jgi:hypothetical protein
MWLRGLTLGWHRIGFRQCGFPRETQGGASLIDYTIPAILSNLGTTNIADMSLAGSTTVTAGSS